MRFSVSFSLYFAFLFLLSGTGSLGVFGPVSADSPEAPAQLEPHQDPRLEQAIQLEGVQLRLFQVTDEISRQTGIEVLAGDDPQDWMVRDLPVTVYVNDLKASVVLQSLAELLHLHLSPEQGKETIAWRLWRDSATRDAVLSFEDKVDPEVARTARDIDKLLEAVNLPENVWGKQPQKDYFRMPSEQSVRDILTAISGLTQEQKEGLKSGTSVLLGTDDLPPGLMERLYTDLFNREIEYLDGRYPTMRDQDGIGFLTQPRETDLKKARLALTPDVKSGYSQISLDPIHLKENLTTSWGTSFGGLRQFVDAYTGGRTTRIDPWRLPLFSTGNANPSQSISAELEEAAYGFLEEEVEDVPKREKSSMFEQESRRKGFYALELAKQNNINVLIEDHWSQIFLDLRFGLNEDPPKIRHLLALAGFRDGKVVCPNNRLLMNQISNRHKQHSQMVPFTVLQMLEQKASTTGIDLDDFLPLAFLTEESLSSWIYSRSHLTYLNVPSRYFYKAPLFQLYAQLTPFERALAHSDSGLPMMSLGLERLGEIAAQINMQSHSGLEEVRNAATDAHHLLGVSLCVTSTPDETPTRIRPEGFYMAFAFYQSVRLPDKKIYQLELRLPDGTLSVPPELIEGLPIYSSERLRELKDEMESSSDTAVEGVTNNS